MFLKFTNLEHPSITIKNFIIFFYFYMIFEGVLRKWLLPNLNIEIYFLKDFFLIIIYFLAIKHNLIFKKKISYIFILFIIITLIFGLAGYNLNKIDLLSFILGTRSYWLFAPLFLIIFNVFSFKDIKNFTKLNLFLILPYYILVIIQTFYPTEALINAGYNSIVQNPERPSAYFTYITQNTYYFLFLISSYFSYLLSLRFINLKQFFFLIIINFF